jgi:hypothetical protein
MPCLDTSHFWNSVNPRYIGADKEDSNVTPPHLLRRRFALPALPIVAAYLPALLYAPHACRRYRSLLTLMLACKTNFVKVYTLTFMVNLRYRGR